MAVCDQHFGLPPALTESDIVDDWRRPRFELNDDTWVVTDNSDEIVAYAEEWDGGKHESLESYCLVHPQHQGNGIGAFLLAKLEERAQAHAALAPARETVLNGAILARDEPAKRLLVEAGFDYARRFWHMQAELSSDTVEPEPPAGVSVRRVTSEGDARLVHEVLEESFEGHWDYRPTPWDDWWRYKNPTSASGFNSGIWLLAIDGDEAVAALVGNEREGEGWVDDLGVRAGWRRRGIGGFLLRLAFAEFGRRGLRKVTLNVDSENPEGATALYERAGMKVISEYDIYQKPFQESP
jgi:mycothiol synthase